MFGLLSPAVTRRRSQEKKPPAFSGCKPRLERPCKGRPAELQSDPSETIRGVSNEHVREVVGRTPFIKREDMALYEPRTTSRCEEKKLQAFSGC